MGFEYEHDSGAKVAFADKSIVNLPLYTKSYQRVRLNKVIEKEGDNIGTLKVPAGKSSDVCFVETTEYGKLLMNVTRMA